MMSKNATDSTRWEAGEELSNIEMDVGDPFTPALGMEYFDQFFHEQNAMPSISTPQRKLAAPNEISHVVIDCLKGLGKLVTATLKESPETQLEVPIALWQDELGRLRVWVANIGAHQTGRSSLDYRLRESSGVKEHLLELLMQVKRLIKDLTDTLDISNENKEDLFTAEHEESSDSEEDEHLESELESIYRALHDAISDLFHMSVTIRRPAHSDRLLGTKRMDALIYEHHDKQHVENKYPDAVKSISDRLGIANSRRRAIMKYRERHHKKLGKGLDMLLGDDASSENLSDTIATHFVGYSEAETAENWDSNSRTSYAQSMLHNGGLPPRPKESTDGELFECPLCYDIISIQSDMAWNRHLFRDLMPYVCIFPDCSTPYRLFGSRQEWYFHFKAHQPTANDLVSLMECPLCLEEFPLGMKFKRHVGRHLQELALFALPIYDTEDDIDPSDRMGGGFSLDLLEQTHGSEGSRGGPADDTSKLSQDSDTSAGSKDLQVTEDLFSGHEKPTPPDSNRESYRCIICEVFGTKRGLFNTFGSLKRHWAMFHDITDTKYRCTQCEKVIMRRDRMREHAVFKHRMTGDQKDLNAMRTKEDLPRTCPVCPKEIPSWEILFDHLRGHCQIFPVQEKHS